jgi:hypothetical protein
MKARMTYLGWRYVLAFLATGTSALVAKAAQFEAIYHNVPGITGNEVPGLGGVTFQANTGSRFEAVIASGSGSWAVEARANFASAQDEVLIVNGQLIGREGTAAPSPVVGNYGNFTPPYSINNAGTFVFSNNTNGPEATDQYILQSAAGVVSVIAQEGQPTGILSNTVWFDRLDSPAISNDGRVGFIGRMVGGNVTPGVSDIAVVFGNSLVAQSGITVPGNQAGGASTTLGDSPLAFSISPNGEHYAIVSNLTGFAGNQPSAIIDGNVAIQYGQAAADLLAPVNSVRSAAVDNFGN